MTTFYLIRHGQTWANTQFIKQGVIDDDRTHLTQTGRQQAARLAAAFPIAFADVLYVSPLQRTRETAVILNAEAQLPVLEDRRLLEISYGAWDGQNNHALERQYPALYDHTLHDVLPAYSKVAPGSEPFAAVVARMAQFMTAVAAARPDQQVIVVTHGFTVKAAALAVLQPKDPMSLPEPENTSVTKITQTETGQRYLWYYNRTGF